MACRLPGAANLQEYWHLLIEGRSAVQELPPERLNRELYYAAPRGTPGKTYSTIAGVVPDVADDPELRDFPAELLARYNSASRHLLAVTQSAFQHAGLDPRGISKVGIFLGHAGGGLSGGQLAFSTYIEDTVKRLEREPEFARLPRDLQLSIERTIVDEVHSSYPRREKGGAPYVTPTYSAALPRRVYGWEGPAMAVDAACASSLQALALAGHALAHEHCKLAVVAGASCNTFYNMILFSQAQALSDTGSFPFDRRANGFVSADGYCAILVEPLERACANGRQILGVVRGIGCSSDGRGHSLWAPGQEGQMLAIERAWGDGLDRSCLDYIEAHATSTPVGDAVELRALAESLGRFIPPDTRIPIASVKANVGHTKEAAGLTSLIKVLLALEHGQIPPATYFQQPQEDVDWKALPFYVPTSPVSWSAPHRGACRRAAIDAFGVGGLNAHVVLDEYVPAASRRLHPAAARRPEAAIVGRGCIFPGARTIAAFEDLMRSGRSTIVPVPTGRWNAELYFQPGVFRQWRSPRAAGGFITDYAYDWKRHKVPPLQVEHADPLQFMLLDAAEQALDDAGLHEGKIDRARTAVVVGTMFGGDFLDQLSRCLLLPEFEHLARNRCREAGMCDCEIDPLLAGFREHFHRDIPALADETGSFSSSTLASRIARTFDLKGGAFAVDAGEASSSAAVSSAVDMLASGRCDAVVCAGAQRQMDVTIYEKLASCGTLASDGGNPPGEGAGVVILKRVDDARRHHAGKIRGVVRDCQVASDAATADAPADTLAGQIGNTLGASGMASLLQASFSVSVQAGVTPGTVIHNSSSTGVAYRLALETDRTDSARQTERPRIAMMFAGQGSQYAGMLRDLVQKRPAADQAMREYDSLLSAYGLPTFAQMAWEDGDALGSDILRTELAVVGADYILYRAVLEMGLTPDLVAGHSLGEHTALVAAGCITLEQAIRMACERSRLLEREPRIEGTLLAVGASTETVADIVARCGAPVFISVHNAARQTVVGGSRGALEEFAKAAEQKGIASRFLQVPQPFHTPLMNPIRAPFHAALEREIIRPARVPFLGTVNCRYLAEPAEIREYLSNRMITTVRYHDALDRLVREESPLVLVEIGPRQVLTGLHRAFARPGVEIIATDHPSRGAEYLSHVQSLVDRMGVRPGMSAAPKTEPAVAIPGPEIVHFDATGRRRAKNRDSARIQPGPDAQPAGESSGVGDFLIRFVCERTGYPPEIVDLDADLEADLGIDSIKKVQLLAELRERRVLSVPPEQRLTLRDFPTLRSILNFIHALEKERPTPAAAAEIRRYVLRTIEAPLRPHSTTRLQGPVLIAGDNSLCAALTNTLRARNIATLDSPGEVARHLILTEGRDEPEPPLESIVELYFLCQQWVRQVIQAGLLSQASITAVTSLGGDFGFSGRIGNLIGGGLSGLLKGIRREFPELRAKVIDAPPDEPVAVLAEEVVAELESGVAEIEVALVRRQRRVVRAVSDEVTPRDSSPVAEGGRWVITGGARGITALLSAELARRYKLDLHLIGSTSIEETDPSEEAKREEIRGTLAAIVSGGATAVYHCCDVSDRQRVAAVLDDIRQSGAITGVLHGAAFEASASFDRKTAEQVTRTIGSKVLGLRHLIELTRTDPLTHFIAFGSVAGRFGGFGQTDYSLSCDLLVKMMQRYRRERPAVASVAFEWPAWSGTGLAMRPETRVVLEMRGIQFLSPEEGVRHFFAELEAGAPEAEVLIASSAGGLDPDQTLFTVDPARQHRLADALIVERVLDLRNDSSLEAEVTLDPGRHVFLRDHRWRGYAMLPAAASAVMLLEAARILSPERHLGSLKDFVIHNPVKMKTEQTALRIRASVEDDGVRCGISREFYNRSGKLVDSRQPVASAIVQDDAEVEPIPLPPIHVADLQWKAVAYRDLEQAESEDHVYFGPGMRCLKELAITPLNPAGRIVAPHPDDARRHGFNPALLDACFVACGIYCLQKLQSPVLVHGVGHLRFARPAGPGEECLLRYVWRGDEDLFQVFDFSLTGANGDPIIEARRCTFIQRGGRQ